MTSGRVYDIDIHIAEVDIETSAREIADIRRHEVADATMQTVHRILTDPPPGSTYREQQQAVAHVMHEYRQNMFTQHLYPRTPTASSHRTDADLRR